MKLYNIYDVACWFIEKNGGSIQSIKLQKLCYYTQAWSYAMREDKPFFDGKFEAWVHGPVNRELWGRCKDIAYRDITVEDIERKNRETFPDEDVEFLENIWETYGDFSGYQLEALTHQEKPWLEQRKGLSTYEPSTKIINTNTMRDYYRSLLSREGVI